MLRAKKEMAQKERVESTDLGTFSRVGNVNQG